MHSFCTSNRALLVYSCLYTRRMRLKRRQRTDRIKTGTRNMAMALMFCMFLLFLAFSGIGLYMMLKTSFMGGMDDRDDLPPEI